MDARGWGWTRSDIRRVQLLESIAVDSAKHPDQYVDVKDFYDGRPDQSENEFTVAWGDVTYLDERGLIAEATGMGGIEAISAMLTPGGRDFLETLLAKRANRGQRRAACRDAMVAWLHSVDAMNDANQFLRDVMLQDPRHGIWLAAPFTASDLADAAVWLRAQELVDGHLIDEDPAPIRLYLTVRGIACAENFDADVSRYLEKQMTPGSGPTVNIKHNSGPFQVAGDHAHQEQHIGASGEHLRELITGLGELVRQVVPDATDLDAQQSAALAAAQDGAVDQSALKRFSAWVLTVVGRGASAALTPVVTIATDEMLHEAAKVAGQLL
jgi:hypothetical protein